MEADFQKTNDGKQILREVMSKYVPEHIVSASKQGFSSPDASWFSGESMDFVKRNLWSNQAKIYDFMDPKPIKNLINQHLKGQKNRRLLIWSLLNVEEYFKQQISS